MLDANRNGPTSEITPLDIDGAQVLTNLEFVLREDIILGRHQLNRVPGQIGSTICCQMDAHVPSRVATVDH